MSAGEKRLPYEARQADLLRVLAAAQREIAAQVMAAIKAGNLNLAGARRLQLAAVLATLDQLGAHVDPAARQLVADAHAQGAAQAARTIAQSGVTLPEIPGAFNSVAVDAVAALQDAITGRLSAARRTVGRTVDDVYARAGRRAALRAVLGVEGSPQAAARQLAADLLQDKAIRKMAQQGGVGFIDKAGRRWQLDTYSEMVVRTTTREAVVQGATDRMISHGVNLARVTVHASSCEICKPYEGRLVSLDGTITDFEGEPVMDASQIPPFHPNCTHNLAPVVAAVEVTRRRLARATA